MNCVTIQQFKHILIGTSMNILKRLTQSISLVRHKTVSPKMKVEKMAQVFPCSDETSFARAAEFLRSGHIIAVPTDTIYGLACSANCPEAIKKLYTIKGRDSVKPVAICVSRIADLRKWGKAEHLSNELLEKLLPGPVTIVLEKTKYLDNPYLNPLTTKIGIRIPKHPFINKVTECFDMPVALTSANFSNEPSTLSIKEFEHLFKYLAAVFDGGVLNLGLEQNRTGSTVVDLSKNGSYNMIRKGILYDEIVQVLESHGLDSMQIDK